MECSTPDDWHHHLRDGEALKTTVPMAARSFRRVIVMPNLVPPVTTTELAMAYKRRILDAVPAGFESFEPLMTLYLTDVTGRDEIERAKRAGIVACKLYPAGATTNSAAGVTDIAKLDDCLRAMAECGMLLLIHGEVTRGDIFDREAEFVRTTLATIVDEYSKRRGLKVVVEHCTTRVAVDFVTNQPAGVPIAATITAHHLLYDRNSLFDGGFRPHMYCRPILKRDDDRAALLAAATSGNPRFFIGTDSAPHEVRAKECACGCAGVFTAHAALELYAEAFFDVARVDKDKYEAFVHRNGPAFYGLPANEGTVVLRRQAWRPPPAYAYARGRLVPLRAGEDVKWALVSREPPLPPVSLPPA